MHLNAETIAEPRERAGATRHEQRTRTARSTCSSSQGVDAERRRRRGRAASASRRRRGRSAPAARGSAASPAAASRARPRRSSTTSPRSTRSPARTGRSACTCRGTTPTTRRRCASTPPSLGLGFDAMNSNTFQDNPSTTRDGAISYKFGSLAHADAAVREAAIEHNLHVIELGVQLGSTRAHGLARRRHEPSRAGELPRASSSACRGLRESTPRCRTTGGCSPSTSRTSRRSTRRSSTTGARRCCSRRRPASGARASSTSAITCRTRTSSRSCRGSRWSAGSAASTSTTRSTATTTSPSARSSRSSSSSSSSSCSSTATGRCPPLAYMIDQSHNLKDPLEDLIQATDAIQLALAQALLRRPRRARRRAGGQRPGARRRGPARAPSAPTSGRSSPRRGGATAPRSIPLATYRAHRLPRREDRRARLAARRHRPLTAARRRRRPRRDRRCASPPSISTPTRPRSTIVHRWSHGPDVRGDGSVRWDWSGSSTNVERGLDGALAPRTARVDRHRHLGRRLRAARRGRRAALAPHCYREPAHARTGATSRDRIGEARAVPTHRHPADADQHDLPARRARPRRAGACATRLLMLPELVVHELTGDRRGERTSAGTTALVDLATGDWSRRPARRDRRRSGDHAARSSRAGTPARRVARRPRAPRRRRTTPLAPSRRCPLGRGAQRVRLRGTWILVGVERDEPPTSRTPRARPTSRTSPARSAASAS